MRLFVSRPLIGSPYFVVSMVFMLAVTSLLGCRDDSQGTQSPDSAEAGETRYDFRLILAGAISDTLTGRAVFGSVIKARSRAQHFVIKMETGVDFVGGMFLARGSTDLPAEGVHPLADASLPDSLSAQTFYLVYREGLLRNLRSREGSVTFSMVSDTLIAGSLEATLAGTVATRSGLRSGEVHVSGRFAAHAGIVGYLIGI